MGIASIREDLPATATQDEIEAAVRRLNEDPACTGFIVQLPLPKGIDTNRVLELVDPDKDADGLHPTNLGRLVLRVNEPVDVAAAVHAARHHRPAARGTTSTCAARTSSSSGAGSRSAARSGCCSRAARSTRR